MSVRLRLAQVGAAAALMTGTIVALPFSLRPEIAAAQMAPANQVAIIMGDFYLNPSASTVKANEPVQFVTPNVGGERHRVSYRLMGSDERVNGVTAGPGEVTVFDMTFPSAGVYEIWCSFTTNGVAHLDSGMSGAITVVN